MDQLITVITPDEIAKAAAEWWTVEDFAAHHGISQRQARRLMARCSDIDRAQLIQRDEKGRQVGKIKFVVRAYSVPDPPTRRQGNPNFLKSEYQQELARRRWSHGTGAPTSPRVGPWIDERGVRHFFM